MSAGFPKRNATYVSSDPKVGNYRQAPERNTPLPPPKIKIKIKKTGPASFLAGIVPGRTAQNKQLQSKGFI